jgi:protein involved in polysaccharide export with SLBB domain
MEKNLNLYIMSGKMIFRKLFLIMLACISLSNAADNSIFKTTSPAITSLPVFFEDQIIRQRDGAAQTPVHLEGPIDSNYIVGPGDFFEIILPSGLEGLQVSPEGTVAIQGCGLVDVNALPLHIAKQKILEKLKTRYDQRFTGVHLVQLRRFVVNVQGAVWNPGQVTVNGQTRVKGAIYSAGNLKPTASSDSVYIYRKGDTIATTENMLLQVGDIINIPHKEWQQTIDLKHLEKIITVPYIPKRTLKEYVEASDLNIGNSSKEVSIKNNEDGFTRWISIKDIGTFVPAPLNEIEFHVQAPFVYVGGAVAAVGKVPYNSSMSPADYVAASGVTIITGDFSRVSVLRNGKWVSVGWADGEILPGDFIEIPRTVYEQLKDITMFITSLLTVIATAFIIASY